ncbi:hypothetical protein ACFL52_04850, partial [Candidatus Margulisiibacteriota bacterium]
MLFFLSRAAAFAFADLSEVGLGARPLALGKAYAALSSDASGIFINPAGLSDYPKLKVVTMMGKLMEDINYFSVGIAETCPLGTFGAGSVSAATGSIPLTTLTNTASGAVVSAPYAYSDYSASIYYLAYSKKIRSNLAFGGSLKYFSQNCSVSTGAMAGALGNGAEVDLGLKWRPRRFLSVALLLKNGLPASMGGKFTWQKNNQVEGIPVVL